MVILTSLFSLQKLVYLIIAHVLLLDSILANTNAVNNAFGFGSDGDHWVPRQVSGTGTKTNGASPTQSSSIVISTETPVSLVESQVVMTMLSLNSTSPARFQLAAPFKNATQPLYIAASLCSGPGIPPYDIDNSTVLKELGLDYFEAMQSTVPIMYVSTDTANQSPGPGNKLGSPDIAYFLGGLATDVNYDKQPDGAWISIYPPADTRNVTGEWTLVVTASSEVQPLKLQQTQGVQFSDSDRNNALLTTYNSSQGVSPDLTLVVLPTNGLGSLQNAYYYNSSICAIAAAYNRFNNIDNVDKPAVNRSDTFRGSLYDNTTRVQWQVSNLQPSTNYSAWLVEVGSSGGPSSILSTSTLWPSVKFTTKRSANCRLVYDIDFCPSVAYSIPVSPSVSTEKALSIINATFSPNFANFSATLDTFPCGDKSFGQYSALQTCGMCKNAYRDWLCAVTMPRCTDSLPSVNNQTSAAYPDPFALMGIETPLNTDLLPYIINRKNDSRQAYIDAENGLDAGDYGEVLPCIYTCYAVASSCPQPLIQWYCPLWDITAQSQYGTFADAGEGGLGEGKNGGAGEYGQRFGGPTRFVAQDGFGNVFCNSMGVQKRFLGIGHPSSAFTLKSPSLAYMSLSMALAIVFLFMDV
ncbi:hypothetical protein L7F22_052790 [Adiantum nelumboides]|nr:hypothetical protein [Adiantum nelumboides]